MCDQLGDLAQVKAAMEKTLSQAQVTEDTLVALAKAESDKLDSCGKTPDSPSCQPDRRSQMTAAIQKLATQAEELQTARQAIEQRLKAIDGQRRILQAKLTTKDDCPHAR